MQMRKVCRIAPPRLIKSSSFFFTISFQYLYPSLRAQEQYKKCDGNGGGGDRGDGIEDLFDNMNGRAESSLVALSPVLSPGHFTPNR